MRLIPAALTLIALAALPVAAQDAAVVKNVETPTETVVIEETVTPAPIVIPVEDATLDDFRWLNRLVLVFADSPLDPAFVRQMDLLSQRLDALADRDVLVLIDTDPSARSAIRLEMRPRGFALVVVDKDGHVIQRKPAPWDVREITRSIDKTPIRQQEMRDRRAAEAEAQGFPQ